MKIAIATLGFDSVKPGGVSNVVLRLIDSLKDSHKLEVVSFALEHNDPYSIQLLNPLTYRRITQKSEFIGDIQIRHFGALGSEFEFLRYRTREDLRIYVETFDALIVVTGFLQVANIIPKLNTPIIIQCATRLIWERESQFKEMAIFRKIILKLQMPLLAKQERKVLLRPAVFLAENMRMKSWLNKNSSNDVKIWYPGTIGIDCENFSNEHPDSNLHFVSVGRFNEPRKGWDRLFNAYRRAHSIDCSMPPLVVVGWGEFSPRDRNILTKVQEDCTILIKNNLPDSERDEVVRNASYFLQSSHEEGLGLAALEALRFGVPLICSDTDGSREYVKQGITGKIVRQGEDFIEDFSNAILESRNWNRKNMSEQCREVFRSRFSHEVASEQIQSIISELTR